MLIRNMTATFGCLDQAELTLEPGLNRLRLDNEQGKSTWAAFLTAMFYGIDTSKRSSKGRLAEKSRYQPWSGKTMAGTVELEWQGRVLVLQRTSERGKPMASFRAWDKETGRDVPELTASNCGLTLLGVERSVFQRSAFLSGAELAVSQDQDLARRLGSLAATGRAEDSYPAAEERLKLWQNRCRYHKTGLIPEIEAKLRQTEGTLEAVEALRRRRMELTAELARDTARADQLEQQARTEAQERRTLLRNALEQAHIRAEAKASQTAALPPEPELQRLLARLEAARVSDCGPEPPCPPALAGVPTEDVWPKAQRDAADYEALAAAKGGSLLLPALLGGILALLALAAGIWGPWPLCLALALGALGAAAWGVIVLRQQKEAKQAGEQARALLDSYGAASKEELLTAALARRDWLLAKAQAERQAWEQTALLEQIAAFAPEAGTAEAARQALEQALTLQRQAAEARQELERAEQRFQHDPPVTSNPQAVELRRHCVALQAELASDARQEEALGGWEALTAKAEGLRETLTALETREQAVILAREVLAAANEQLAQVYSPQLTGLAGEYLRQLTRGRYDGLVLEQPLELSVRETETGLVRPLAALSRGTQDQAWLALRLAMTRLLLPEGTPVVLDDALLTFDPGREQAALELLARENRQVLLFSCR